jgi:hypothetical protein
MSKKLFITKTPAGSHDKIFLEGEVPHLETEELDMFTATEMFNSGIGIFSYDAQLFVRGK